MLFLASASIFVVFAPIPMTSFAETVKSNSSQNNSSDIAQPKDTKEDSNKDEADRIYIRRGKNLTVNWISHRAGNLLKVQYAEHFKNHKYNPISKIKGYDKYRIIRIK